MPELLLRFVGVAEVIGATAFTLANAGAGPAVMPLVVGLLAKVRGAGTLGDV